MIAALIVGAALATATTDPSGGLSVAVSPQSVSITGIAPGRSGSAQVEVTNNGTRPVVLTVSGSLSAPNATGPDDLLRVDLRGCSTAWLDLPDTPACTGATDGDADLAAVRLEVGAHTWVLITAGLDKNAGNGAMGQTWTADLSLTAAATDTPTAPPALATTGAAVVRTAGLGGLVAAAGVALTHLARRKKKGLAR